MKKRILAVFAAIALTMGILAAPAQAASKSCYNSQYTWYKATMTVSKTYSGGLYTWTIIGQNRSYQGESFTFRGAFNRRTGSYFAANGKPIYYTSANGTAIRWSGQWKRVNFGTVSYPMCDVTI